jgi:FkbM family methyltransferase
MKPKIVLDVGAGMWKHYKDYLTPHKPYSIFCFEPHPELNKKLVDIQAECTDLHVSSCAVSDESKENRPFYILNDPVASSLCQLNSSGIRKWKYPFRRPAFRVIDTIKVNTTSVHDFVKDNKFIKKYGIHLLNIDIQGDCVSVLDGIPHSLYKKIKRIIIKCIDVPFELYKHQSEVVDVIDKLRVNNFTLLRGCKYSRGQEQILEFVNNAHHPNHHEMNPMFRLLDTGEFMIDLDG